MAVELVHQCAQVNRLVCRGCFIAPAHAAVARPANLRQQQWLFREQFFQVLGTVEYVLAGLVHRNEFPERQDVRGNQVDVLGQLRVLFPDVPLLGRGHRHFYRGTHAVQQHDQRLWGDFFPEQRFVTDHYPHDAARTVGQFDGALDLTFVTFKVRADPDTQGHAQTELFGQLGNIAQGAVDRVGTDVVRQLAHDLEVATHFFVAGVLVFLRELALLERRVGKPGDLFGPVGGSDRAVDQRPETGEQRGNCQHHHQVESKFTR